MEADERFAKIGRIERKEYDKLKRRALRFELKNRGYILVIPCDGDKGWCEMGDASALFYKYFVCDELGVPVNLTDDADSFYAQYTYGRVRTRGFDVVRKRIKKAGLFKSELAKDKSVIFVLNKKISEKEIESLERREDERQNAVNDIAKVKFADPILYQKMVLVVTRLHRVCFRRMDKLSSSTNGKKMVELADNMLREYFHMTEQDDIKWEDLYRYTKDLLIELQIVACAKLWTRDACVNISEDVMEVQKRIERQMGRAANKSK